MTAKKKNQTAVETEPQEHEETPAETRDATAGSETPMSPEEELAAAKARADEANDRFLRTRAEMENLRKRAQRDLTEAREYVKGATAAEFFSTYDHFQMAMAHAEESPDLNTLKQGMTMILAEFQRSFENLGIAVLDAAGKEFDPEQHEAVAQEPSDTVPAGVVLRQWKCGYKLGDKLLRPASVVVSSGPPEDLAEASEPE
jgi:molecular chaperone GrpE